jgi:mitofilin
MCFRYDRELNTKLTEEKEDYSNRLKAALSRLRGIEAAVDSRADIEKANKKSQDLFVACQSLLSAMDSGLKALRPLFPEVNAIQNAAPNDAAVTRILAAVPEEALERGIYNEKSLAARFPEVLRSCRRVAMVGEDNRGPWTYFLSYIQSFFIIDKFDPRKDGELIDVENVDTFGLLARAEYYVRKGDLELAARLVNQLQGEPRKLAYGWLKEVRLLLETRQAARFLSSYAAATGMGGLEN